MLVKADTHGEAGRITRLSKLELVAESQRLELSILLQSASSAHSPPSRRTSVQASGAIPLLASSNALARSRLKHSCRCGEAT
jgi:hypothetical protein